MGVAESYKCAGTKRAPFLIGVFHMEVELKGHKNGLRQGAVVGLVVEVVAATHRKRRSRWYMAMNSWENGVKCQCQGKYRSKLVFRRLPWSSGLGRRALLSLF